MTRTTQRSAKESRLWRSGRIDLFCRSLRTLAAAINAAI